MASLNRGAIAISASVATLHAVPPSTTSNFADLPGAVMLDLVNLSSSAPVGPFLVDVGGTIVTVTSTSTLGGPGPYFMGFFDFSTWTFRHPNNPAIDPGEWDGFFSSYNVGLTGHPVLDFEPPLAGFGITTMQFWAPGSQPPTSADTLRAYDGPNGTGNLIALISTKPAPGTQFWAELDFVGILAGDGPPIRSVVIDGGANSTAQIYLDAIVLVGAGEAGCPADLSGSADPNDPAYGQPDGNADAADFFYFLDVFVAGCP